MKSKTGFLALSLLGFGLVGIACGGSSDSGDDTGSTAGTTSTTAGTGTGIGGSTSTAGTNSSSSGTTNNSSGTGNTTAGAGTGGTASGGTNNNGGNTNGGRTNNNGGAGGFVNNASCPATAPMDGDMCMLPGTGGAGGTGTGGTGGTGTGGRQGGGNNLNCAYGTTFCQCARQNGMRAWNCRTFNGGGGTGGTANGGTTNGGAGGNTFGMAMCGDAPANGDTCTGFGACTAGAGCRCRQGMVQSCN